MLLVRPIVPDFYIQEAEHAAWMLWLQIQGDCHNCRECSLHTQNAFGVFLPIHTLVRQALSIKFTWASCWEIRLCKVVNSLIGDCWLYRRAQCPHKGFLPCHQRPKSVKARRKALQVSSRAPLIFHHVALACKNIWQNLLKMMFGPACQWKDLHSAGHTWWERLGWQESLQRWPQHFG